MSLSSMGLWGRPGVPAGAPFRRLCWVNKMFMVASNTSDRLWRTCGHGQEVKNLHLRGAQQRNAAFSESVKLSDHLVAEVSESSHSLLHAVLTERKKLQTLHHLIENTEVVSDSRSIRNSSV